MSISSLLSGSFFCRLVANSFTGRTLTALVRWCIAFWPTFLTTINRIGGMEREILDSARMLQPSNWTMIWKVLLPYILLNGGFHFEGMNPAGWICLLAVGLIHSALAYVLYFSSLKSLPGHEAAILSYIDPLVAVLISLAVLREPVAPAQLLGGAMILAFTLGNELKK